MKSSELVCYILDYLDSNLYREVTIDELCIYFGYEKSYLMKKFKSELGISIKTYVNRKKIIKSLNQLGGNELLLKVALENGFNSLEYYSEVFSKVMGFSPSLFRRYLNGIVTKEELELIRSTIDLQNEFEEFVNIYRNNLSKDNNKILRLEIPKEKKCA